MIEDEISLADISNTFGKAVPNRFPTVNSDVYRIAIIGDSPTRDEEIAGEPFAGPPGRMLKGILSRVGVMPDACYFGHISQLRPPANDITAFAYDGAEIQAGLAQLKKDLSEFKPWLIVLLGKSALYAAAFRSDIANMRGSLFLCDRIDSPFFGYKCISTYHPSACLKVYENTPIFTFDLRRSAEEGKTAFLSLPKRDLHICRTVDDVLTKLSDVKTKSGTDIEGYVFDLQCLAIAPQTDFAFTIPFKGPNGDSFWQSESEEIEVWKALARYLENPHLYKVWQNGMYDRFVMQYSYHIVCRGNAEDTMLQWHELYAELPKNLAIQTSLLTREPFYKSERLSESWETKMQYCGKDACVTLEINNKITPRLNATSTKHYYFNRDLLNPLLYMELRGMVYNTEEAKTRREGVLQKLYQSQFALDKITQFGFNSGGLEQATLAIKDLMCYKRGTPLILDSLPSYVKKEYSSEINRAVELAKKVSILTESERGELSTLLKLHNNVDSPKFTKFLYGTLKLPVQINKQTKQPTADYLALMKLYKSTKNEILKHAIDIRRHGQDQEMLAIHADPDGRIRCSYNAVGTNTGRLSCSTSPTGSGYNLTTIQKKDRDLFMADPDHWFFQCDLSGADGWTIGAWCRMLGDSTMFDDLVNGLKPAQAVCLLLRYGASVNSKSREELKALAKSIDKDGYEYFMCKQGIWGTCYTMGSDKLAETIFKKSKGEVALSRKEVSDFQRLVLIRYHGVVSLQKYMERALAKNPVITAASGLTRRFFGRPDDNLGNALAFEPQANTTYATNLAMYKLWTDPNNRRNDIRGSDNGTLPLRAQSANRKLRIEPLHQVHDALCGQFRKEDTSWAIAKIKSYFADTLTIANQKITIPFEGNYGVSWGKLEEGVI